MKKEYNVLEQSLKDEEIIFLREFIFVFTPNIIGAILLQKIRKKSLEKIHKKGADHVGGLSTILTMVPSYKLTSCNNNRLLK